MVLASSKLTTASAFSRLTSALVTPPTLVNDLFTEATHDDHVIPDTDSVTVLISANAAVTKITVAKKHAASSPVSRFMVGLSIEKRYVIGKCNQREHDDRNHPEYRPVNSVSLRQGASAAGLARHHRVAVDFPPAKAER